MTIDSRKYWLEQLANRSKSTRESYQIYFNNFLEYVKATPNQLIERQRAAIKSDGDPRLNHALEAKVRSWLADLQKVKSPATCRLALASVKSFFELNEHPLRMKRRDRPQGESEGSRIPEKSEVIEIADGAKWKYRAAIMFLKDSGLRLSDLVRVRWEDAEDLGDGYWNFNLTTQKRKVAACAFVGPETVRLLNQFKSKTDRIFATTPNAVSKRINTIIREVGIKGVSVHGLRKYFVTSMEHARVPEQQYLHMMGKKSSVYSEKRRSELFNSYKKAYPELSIYAAISEDVEKLKQRIIDLEQQFDDVRDYNFMMFEKYSNDIKKIGDAEVIMFKRADMKKLSIERTKEFEEWRKKRRGKT